MAYFPDYPTIFNGNNLSLIDGVTVFNYESNGLPDRDIKINKIARSNRSIITSSEYTQKEIPVYMEICSGSRSDTEQTIAFVKALLQKQNADLVVPQGNESIKYIATMNEFNIEWEIATAVVTVVFLISDMGKNMVQSDLLTSKTITTQTDTSAVVVGGSVVAEPAFYIYVTSVTGATNQTMNIFNSITGQGISITRTFVAGDNIEIDSENKLVMINGAYTDFSGVFPIFDTGPQSIGYSDTFSTRSVNLVSKYYKRYA